MITASYVLTMARYNAWQNKQIMDVVKGMDDKALRKNRKAFFDSIMGTLNHLLWGDTLWMSRWCTDVTAPKAKTKAEMLEFAPTLGIWQAERFKLDGRIRIWAETLSNLDLLGDMTWVSGSTGVTSTKPKALCVAHMFNHQTHHRGQVHAMLTQAGQNAPVTDLVFLPED